MSINPDPNRLNLAEQNREYTMTAVAKVAIWIESHLSFPGEPPAQTVDLDELFEGKLPAPTTMPRLKREQNSNMALQRLVANFELTDTEVLILLATVATELINGFARMCGAYNSSIERSTPTFAMIASLFTRSTAEPFDYRATSDQSNLRRWGLIQVNELNRFAFYQSPLVVDPSILNYLLGHSYHDGSIEQLVNFTPAVRLNSSSQITACTHTVNRIATQVQRAIAEQYPVLFQLTGTDVTNKDNLVEAVASSIGSGLLELNYLNVPTDNEQLWMLATRLRRWQKIDGSLPYIKASGLRKDDHQRSDALMRLMDLLEIPALISTEEPTNWGRVNTTNTEVKVPNETDQLALWRRYLGRPQASRPLQGEERIAPELERDLPKLVSQFNLTAPAIKAIATQYYLDSSSSQLSAFERLWDCCRIQARQKLDSLATRVDSQASWDNLILPDSVKDSLSDIVAQVGLKHLVYGTWGMKSNRGLGITALFSGVSGTGKTTAAEVIANELKLDLYKIDLSTVISKYIGETEKNLRRIFDAAEAGGAILLFDEADALFGKRTEVKDSKDRHSNAEISYLLQKMEAYSGLAILTTNLPDAIDSAFKRRLRFVVDFAFPDVVAQEKIWRSAFPHAAPTIGLDYRGLAELNLTGGNIRSVALNAAFQAARNGEAIGMKQIVSAALTEAKKLGNSTHHLEAMKSRLNSELSPEVTASAFPAPNLDLAGKGDESQGNTHTPSNDGVSHDIKSDRLWQKPSFKSEETANQTSNRQNIPHPEPTKSSDNSTQIPTQRIERDPFSQPRNPNPTPERDYSKMSPQEILDSTAPYLRNNDRSSACSILRNALAYYPEHSGLNFWLGKTACEGKLNYTEALTALERAERGNGQWLNNPESEKANWYWQATVLLAMPEDNPEKASDLCLKYLKALPQGIYATKAQQKHNEARKRIAYKKLGGGG